MATADEALDPAKCIALDRKAESKDVVAAILGVRDAPRLLGIAGVLEGTAGNESKISFSNNGEGRVDASEDTDIHDMGRESSGVAGFIVPNPR